MSGATRNHNRVSGNFFRLLDDALADRACEVYIVDVKVQVEPGQKYLYDTLITLVKNADN